METAVKTENLKFQIKASKRPLPVHVAIIMDGNGRWARKQGLMRTEGHIAGVRAVKKVVRAADDIGINYLTLFTFSSENWCRPPFEVDALMKLLYETTRDEIDELDENNVRLITTGDIEGLPEAQREILHYAVERTKHNTGMTLNLALNYGGRGEIINAVRSIVSDCMAGKIDVSHIDEHLFASYLYTTSLPDPDLLIRTSGEMRISNFMLWQTSYTELYITPTYWPEFNEDALFNAILDFQSRERRFGCVPPKSSG
ncbi:MAG: isoprenyl transferase [candidate division Zixibacteria bacterium]|nr:isoprenyl transferase [candidate division Zixibacteria bacterium]